MTSSIRRRVFAGMTAQVYSQMVTIGTQLISVPVLIYFWGIEQYGVWVLISAIPLYLSLADLGFAQVGASDMTMRLARGDRDGALASYHTVIAMNLAMGLIALAILIALALSPLSAVLIGTDHLTSAVQLALVVLIVHALVSLTRGVVTAGLRAEGRLALGVALFSTVRVIETASMLATAALGGDLLAAALAMLGGRTVGTLAIVLLVERRWPWLKLRLGHFQSALMKKMLAPSLHFLGYTIGNLVSIQGTILTIGAVLGPSAAAVASTVRTLARLGVTAANMLNFTLLPEYSAHFGRGDKAAVVRLSSLHLLGIGALVTAYLIAMLTLGGMVYGYWTHDAVVTPSSLLTLLILASATDMVWTALQAPAIAANNMRISGLSFLVLSFVSVIVLALVLPDAGLLAFGWVGLATALVMCVPAYLEFRVVRRVAAR